MKKSLLLFGIAAVTLLGFKALEEKKYKAEFTQEEWNARYSWVSIARAMLEKSNLPINEVKPLNDSLSKFLNELSMQIIPQLPKDTTKKK